MYDIAIIGGGITGAMVARELSAYDLKICVLEKESDVAMGATKANSAIVHAGFDAEEGTLKAALNVKGSEMMERVANELGVKYKRNGSIVIGFNDDDKEMLEVLYNRGIANGVQGLRLLSKSELKEAEPNISDDAICALYAPSGAITCPYELTIAAMGNAMDNGTDLKLNFCVTEIKMCDGIYTIYNDKEYVQAKYIVNAAGLYSDRIANMVGDNTFKIHPRKGEYILLDKEAGSVVSHTIFRTPTKAGKGILVTPTVDGNLLTGPTSLDGDNKEDRTTTCDGLEKVKKEASENVCGIDFGKTIASFCGLRAAGDTGDFIINGKDNFVNVAGIESPGLSASPAIGEYVAGLLFDMGLKKEADPQYSPYRKSMTYFKEASEDEKNRIIKEDSSYGKIVCRCEAVTEGEIKEAIRTNPKPTDMDGVKRRTRAQMGRCQGGFCSGRIMELLAEAQNIPFENVTKFGGGSFMVTGKTKGGEVNE